MKIEIAGIYWPEFFFYFFFTSLPTIFGGWVFQIYYQDKTIIVKNLCFEKRPLESYDESMDKHSATA